MAGGVALVLHGVVRFTADLDLIVDLERENLTTFVRAMTDLGYQPRNPVKADDLIDPENGKSWKSDKGFSFIAPSSPMELIDVFIDESIPFKQIEKELVTVKAKAISIPVVSVRHLKQLKKISNRPQDHSDIEALEDLEKGEKE